MSEIAYQARSVVSRRLAPEVVAGLLLVDTEIALLTYVANDIRVGDRVMWAEQPGLSNS